MQAPKAAATRSMWCAALGAASGPAVAKILARPDLVEMLFKGDTAKYQDAVKKLDLSSVAP